ncbi:MAG: hypothetical protein ACM37W_26965, partial [Actinomycetota bacterium]
VGLKPVAIARTQKRQPLTYASWLIFNYIIFGVTLKMRLPCLRIALLPHSTLPSTLLKIRQFCQGFN